MSRGITTSRADLPAQRPTLRLPESMSAAPVQDQRRLSQTSNATTSSPYSSPMDISPLSTRFPSISTSSSVSDPDDELHHQKTRLLREKEKAQYGGNDGWEDEEDDAADGMSHLHDSEATLLEQGQGRGSRRLGRGRRHGTLGVHSRSQTMSGRLSSIVAWATWHIRSLPRPLFLLAVATMLTMCAVVFTIKRQDRFGDALQMFQDSLTKSLRPTTDLAIGASLSETTTPRKPDPNAVLARRPIPLQSHLEFLKDDGKYLEAWVARGEVLPGLDFSKHASIDGLWYWVNGTDPRHHAARDFFAMDPSRHVELPEHVRGKQRLDHDDDGHSALASRGERLEPRKLLGALLEEAKAAELKKTGVPRPAKNLQNSDSRFREQDELRYSLRSAKASLGDWLRTSHLVSTDFWPSGHPEEIAVNLTSEALLDASRKGEGHRDAYVRLLHESSPSVGHQGLMSENIGQSDVFHIEEGLLRYGQIPQWLDVDHPSVRVGDRARIIEEGPAPALRVHHDWNIFSHLENIEPATQALAPNNGFDMLEYKLRVLPTFNSMAAEASLAMNVTDLSEAFFYSNDDNFLGRRLTPADFSTPLYGPVLHINRGYVVHPNQRPAQELGEHPSMKYSAYLLGERFGDRPRSYIIHVHKTHLRPLVLESRLMWGSEFAQASSKRFRADGRSTNSHMLSYNFIIERHREALLWSYFVLKVDRDGDGSYSRDELQQAWADLGLSTEDNIWRQENARVPYPHRKSVVQETVDKNLQDSGFPAALETSLLFSSQDGYGLAGIHRPSWNPDDAWPQFHLNHDDEETAAYIKWSSCWPKDVGRDPVELFKHMAFKLTDCGDFFITLLTARQGTKGLDIFLPYADTWLPLVSTAVNKEETTPHLPLDARWADADFSMAAVARNTGWVGLSRRTFAMLMIQRYSYSIGGTPVIFEMLTSPYSAKNSVRRLRQGAEAKGDGQQGFALIGINDDIRTRWDETVALFKGWMESAWPTATRALPYERSKKSGWMGRGGEEEKKEEEKEEEEVEEQKEEVE